MTVTNAEPKTAAREKFDGWRVFFIVLFVLVFIGGAVGLSYMSVHLGWFKSWEDWAWVVGIGAICLAAAALPSSRIASAANRTIEMGDARRHCAS